MKSLKKTKGQEKASKKAVKPRSEAKTTNKSMKKHVFVSYQEKKFLKKKKKRRKLTITGSQAIKNALQQKMTKKQKK